MTRDPFLYPLCVGLVLGALLAAVFLPIVVAVWRVRRRREWTGI